MALLPSMSTGVSALQNLSKGVTTVASNIANVNSIGHKGGQANFKEASSNILQRSSPSEGADSSNIISSQIGQGMQLSSVTPNFSQGAIEDTGVDSNVAIVGEGFFRVKDPKNKTEFATRAGDFRFDDQGYLVNSQGYRVQGLVNGSISYAVTGTSGNLTWTPTLVSPAANGDVKADRGLSFSVGSGITNSTGGAVSDSEINANAPKLSSVEIDEKGNVKMMLSNGNSFTQSQLLLVNFNDLNALVAEGDGLYTGFDAAKVIGGMNYDADKNSPGSSGLGTLRSRALEYSNVDLTREMTQLMTLQRSFQASARIMTTSDEILQEVVSLKR